MSPPQLITNCRQAFEIAQGQRQTGHRLGIVPTMGALHAGHLRLVEASQRLCDSTVVSIFVNPTQFGPQEDLARYPRQLQRDLELLAPLGVDWVFAPSDEDIFPPGFSTFVEPGSVAQRWEGVCRPNHFRGVTTVVLKLLQIVPAHCAVFGRKDYQQAKVIQQMARDLNLPVEIRVEETVRESQGLALSSRNAYLTPEQRRQAQAVPESCQLVQRQFAEGEVEPRDLEQVARDRLLAAGIDRIDYVALVDPETLDPVSVACHETVLLLAVYVGNTRLIDNVTLAPTLE